MSDQPTEPLQPPAPQGPQGPSNVPGRVPPTPANQPPAPQGAGWPGQMPPPPPPGAPPGVPFAPLPPGQQPPSRPQKRNQFFLGLGTGIIPLVLALLATGVFVGQGSPLSLTTPFIIGLIVAAAMYIASIITMIVCLARERLRFIGYGLLTTFLATPVLGFVGCIAAINYASTPH